MTRIFEEFLFAVSSALYLPVIALVSVLCLYVLWAIGALCADAGTRLKRRNPALAAFSRRIEEQLRSKEPHLDVRLERLLQEVELDAAQRLDRIRFVIKVGPALGLMGTLIPMGISLAALAQGNVPQMANSMVTAFTATVAGLACSVGAYLIALIRESWARADLREMEFMTELAARGAGIETEKPMEVSHALSAPAAAA
jgi:biopolymer transport protein ExbB/TolQ